MEGTPSTACWVPEQSVTFQQRVLLFGSVHRRDLRDRNLKDKDLKDKDRVSSLSKLSQVLGHGRAMMLQHQGRQFYLQLFKFFKTNYFTSLGGGTSSDKH